MTDDITHTGIKIEKSTLVTAKMSKFWKNTS